MMSNHASTDAVLAVLGQADDPELIEIVDLVASTTGAPFAAISVMHGENYHLHVTSGIEPLVCRANDSLCIHTMGEHRSVVTNDAATDLRFYRSPYVDGSLMSLRFYASAPIYEPGGAMVGRLCTFGPEQIELSETQLRTLDALAAAVTDIIELRLRRAEHPQALRPAADSPEGIWAAQVGHDMLGPLSSIMATLEFLEDELGPGASPAAVHLLRRAEGAARRLLTMTHSVVGGITETAPRLCEVALDDVAAAVLRDLESLVQRQGARVLAQHLPIVTADPDQLYSVLLNLVTNSLKYAHPERRLELQIWSRRVGDRWRIYVADNGVGIPEQKREAVFGMFTRATDEGEGAGVGLATVHHIVSAHRGQVAIEETPGGGTTVWFELPRFVQPLPELPSQQDRRRGPRATKNRTA